VARGRPPARTREQVVDAAVAVADAEGLGAVTIRRVAAEVGAGAMSLYTYVPDKDRLVDLMLDRVGGTAGYPPLTGDWRADLLGLMSAQRELMRRHPWIPAALPNRQLTGVNTLAYLEHGLAALAPIPLSGAAKMETIALLTGFVASYVTNELAADPTGEQLADRVCGLREAVATGGFPHLAAVLAELGGGDQGGGLGEPAPEAGADFERIATRMINGLVSAGGS
jgi:AcrR family transcriptional regulator